MRCCLAVLCVTLLCGGQAMIASEPLALADIGVPSQRVALKLYARLAGPSGNVFFSPFSIAEAVSMTQVGAAGDTARQMQALLEADPAAYGAWARLLNAAHGDFELHTGNTLWVQQDRPFASAFLKSLKAQFDAEPKSVDFTHNADAIVKQVNDWIAKQTQDKIKDLLGPGSISADTRLVLANAVYFKAKWDDPFEAHATSSQPFHKADGKEISVPTMRQAARYSLYGDKSVQVLEMPYRGGEVSMLIVLPREVGGLAEIEKTLSPEMLAAWSAGAKVGKVIVNLPKFSMRQTLDLVKPLRAMGLTDLFEGGKADLSGIDGTRELYVSAVSHGAFVKVDEEGTEAAAATVMHVGAAAARPEPMEEFIADHPFMFMIRHNRTGGILFIGRVAEPETTAK